jgi:16S rRNA A1518/A1519 N6-dimethyltransferase RsmA/KsgA/DIM1 with predicted DNA glycosylase/AP lyase activity
VTAEDLVVEVGPGTGNLTRHLIATGAQIVAVEKDDTLVEKLREEFAEVGVLSVHSKHQKSIRSWLVFAKGQQFAEVCMAAKQGNIVEPIC